jgi:hypothetical protein
VISGTPDVEALDFFGGTLGGTLKLSGDNEGAVQVALDERRNYSEKNKRI